ncbi:hypothetical protein GOP47_0000087 [Adiantum capillus-veneris]|uniref:Uncharacterized protein n=1 Tax=Adiantum capillus-veneris TaxID=13818 RepID=A0A9D4ZQD5_ADICA|nr:hypothetical protein GOP47_0000087 [Adiantum capillus-veneris]
MEKRATSPVLLEQRVLTKFFSASTTSPRGSVSSSTDLSCHSNVRSLTLDVKVWEPSVISLFQSIGNGFANSIWEEELLHDVEKDNNTQYCVPDSTERNYLDEDKEELTVSSFKPRAKDPLSLKEKFIHTKYAEKQFILRSSVPQRLLSVACRIWNAVQVNNKQIVYALLLCFDADVNTTYEQAMSQAQEGAQKPASEPPTALTSESENRYANSLDSELDLLTKRFGSSSLSTKTLDSIMDGLKMDGWVLLHLACYMDDVGMVELLLQYGAQVNARDSLGRTPLHLCILYRKNSVAKLLLTRGASPAAIDEDGKTPLQIAMELGAVTDEELFVLLSQMPHILYTRNTS